MSLVLDDKAVVRTLERLQARIAERFPDAGLAAVCGELTEEARKTAGRARRIARPDLAGRLLVLLVLVAAAAAAWTLGTVALRGGIDLRAGIDPVAFAQGLDSAVNLLIVAGAAVWFLLGREARLKREAALDALHALRSYAHVVDMHQLTKDPTMVLAAAAGRATAQSPKRAMSEFELTRYLEYCAEMLALIGKLAALYAAATRDAQVLAAVNDVETLTTDLGRKIWQKITILSALDETRAR